MPAALNKKGNIQHYRRCILFALFCQELLRFRPDLVLYDFFVLLQNRFIVKHFIRHPGTVQFPIGQKALRSEKSYDFLQAGVSFFHCRPAGGVRVKDGDAQGIHVRRYCTFPAADAAG